MAFSGKMSLMIILKFKKKKNKNKNPGLYPLSLKNAILKKFEGSAYLGLRTRNIFMSEKSSKIRWRNCIFLLFKNLDFRSTKI